MLVELNNGVFVYVVAARDHEQAWRLVREELPQPDRDEASLEELEATCELPIAGLPRILTCWKTAPLGEEATGSSGTASEAA